MRALSVTDGVKCGAGSITQRASNGGTGIDVPYQNAGRLPGQNIPQQTASHSGQCPQEHKQKQLVRVSVLNAGIDAHYRKDPQAYGIHQQQDLVREGFQVSLQPALAYRKSQEQRQCGQTGGHHIDRGEQSAGNHAEDHIPHHSAAYRCDHTKDTDAE